MKTFLNILAYSITIVLTILIVSGIILDMMDYTLEGMACLAIVMVLTIPSLIAFALVEPYYESLK